MTSVRVIPAAVAAGFTVLSAAGVTASLVQSPRCPRVDRVGLWGESAREALVLGSGGIVGAAWAVGMLARLEQAGLPLRGSRLVIGTSAGSLVGALLRTGAPYETLLDLARFGETNYRGRRVVLPGPRHDAHASHLPVAPRDFFTSPAFAARRLRVPHLAAAAAGLMPPSGFTLEDLASAVDGLWLSATGSTAWPEEPTWIVAGALRDGQRVVFGAPDEPRPLVGRAVAASCAVPGALAPVGINGRRYVDGAVVSMTNVDLAFAAGADRIWVLHPMAGIRDDREPGLVARGDRLVRRFQERQLGKWIRRAQERGVELIILTPSETELEAMGPRLMDLTRAPAVVDAVLARRANEFPASAATGSP